MLGCGLEPEIWTSLALSTACLLRPIQNALAASCLPLLSLFSVWWAQKPSPCLLFCKAWPQPPGPQCGRPHQCPCGLLSFSAEWLSFDFTKECFLWDIFFFFFPSTRKYYLKPLGKFLIISETSCWNLDFHWLSISVLIFKCGFHTLTISSRDWNRHEKKSYVIFNYRSNSFRLYF